jgi:hypothetical protein
VGKPQSDGGWTLSSLGWTWRGMNMHSLIDLWIRSNDTPLAAKSDGYATGLKTRPRICGPGIRRLTAAILLPALAAS